jgi:hypothetical protein
MFIDRLFHRSAPRDSTAVTDRRSPRELRPMPRMRYPS